LNQTLRLVLQVGRNRRSFNLKPRFSGVPHRETRSAVGDAPTTPSPDGPTVFYRWLLRAFKGRKAEYPRAACRTWVDCQVFSE